MEQALKQIKAMAKDKTFDAVEILKNIEKIASKALKKKK